VAARARALENGRAILLSRRLRRLDGGRSSDHQKDSQGNDKTHQTSQLKL
jgi:hypothetical protein